MLSIKIIDLGSTQQSVWVANLINVDEFVGESRTNRKKDESSLFLHTFISVFVYYKLILSLFSPPYYLDNLCLF